MGIGELLDARFREQAEQIEKPGKTLLINERLFIAAALQIDVPRRPRGRAA